MTYDARFDVPTDGHTVTTGWGPQNVDTSVAPGRATKDIGADQSSSALQLSFQRSL